MFLWLLIAIYAYSLPNARVIYNALVNSLGQDATGKVPVLLVAITGLVYSITVLITQKSLKNILVLIPCGIIAYLIMTLEPNPNKHIHIPEYVLMAWLLFAVLSMDYKSSDIIILVFILTSMLGVVDELEQGIHPARFYGWSDMLVNSASALIGVFTIMGLKKMKPLDLDWTHYFKEIKGILLLIFLGLISTTITCIYLFRVQAAGEFRGVYPTWLWVFDIAFVIITTPAIYLLFRKHNDSRMKSGDTRKDLPCSETRIAQLWIIPMLVILFYMKSILIYISLTGLDFV